MAWGRVLLAPEILRLLFAEEGREVKRAFQGKSATVLLPPGVSGRLSPAKGEAQRDKAGRIRCGQKWGL